MSRALALTVCLTTVAVSSLAAAVVLSLTNHDAQGAWGGFVLAVGVLTGQQLPAPGDVGEIVAARLRNPPTG